MDIAAAGAILAVQGSWYVLVLSVEPYRSSSLCAAVCENRSIFGEILLVNDRGCAALLTPIRPFADAPIRSYAFGCSSAALSLGVFA
jgi:hypothetical protein